MKKLALCVALAASAAGFASAEDVTLYTPGTAITTADQLVSGKYFMVAASKSHDGFLKMRGGYYKENVQSFPNGTSDATYVYDITVTPGEGETPATFTIKSVADNSYLSYSGNQGDGKGNIVPNTDATTAAHLVLDTENTVEVAEGMSQAKYWQVYQTDKTNAFGGTEEKTPYFHVNGSGFGSEILSWWSQGVFNFTGTGSATTVAFLPATESTVTPPAEPVFVADQAYKFRNVGAAGLYLNVDQNAGSNAILSSDASIIYLTVNPSNANQFAIHGGSATAANLGVSSWNTACKSTTVSYWTLTNEYDAANNVWNTYIARVSDGLYIAADATDADSRLFSNKAKDIANGTSKWIVETVTQSAEEILAAAKADALEGLALLGRVVDLSAITAAINDAADAAAVNTLVSQAWGKLDGVVFNIKNSRRTNGTTYLTSVNGSTINTTTVPNREAAKWTLRRSGTNFKIQNLGTGKFINSASLSDNGSDFQLAANVYNGSEKSVAIKNTGNNNGLNVNTQGGNLETYDHTDGGSAWEFSVVGNVAASDVVKSTAESRTYYRIRSNRGMTERNVSLLGIAGAKTVETPANDEVHLYANGIGTIWYFEAQEEGVALRNLIADIDGTGVLGMNAGSGDASGRHGRMTPTATTFYIRPASDWQASFAFNGNPIAIATDATSNGSVCADINGYNNPICNEWSPEGTNTNNGSIYYLELVDAEEVAELTEAYIADAKNAIAGVSHSDKLDNLAQHTGLWTAEELAPYRQMVAEAVGEISVKPEDVTTIAKANAMYSAVRGKGMTADEFTASVVTPLLATAPGKTVRIKSAFYEGKYMTLDADATKITSSSASGATADNIWTLAPATDGAFTLVNVTTGKKVGHQASQSNEISLAEEGQAYQLVFNANQSGLAIWDGEGNSTTDYLHHNSGTSIVKWNANAEASYWIFEAVEEIAEADLAIELTLGENAAISFTAAEGLTLNPGHSASVITIAKKAEEEGIALMAASVDVPVSSLTETTNGYTLDLTSAGLDADADYTVSVPAGVFVSNGKLSKAISYAIHTDASGEVTGIDEIIANGSAKSEIYDLQGRRVSNATRGLYIINGRKVLVR